MGEPREYHLNLDTVRCKRLLVCDDNGTPRVSVGLADGGESGGGDGPMLQLYDANGRTRLTLCLVAQGHPMVSLHNEKGDMALVVSLGPDDKPSIVASCPCGDSLQMLAIAPPAAPGSAEAWLKALKVKADGKPNGSPD